MNKMVACQYNECCELDNDSCPQCYTDMLPSLNFVLPIRQLTITEWPSAYSFWASLSLPDMLSLRPSSMPLAPSPSAAVW